MFCAGQGCVREGIAAMGDSLSGVHIYLVIEREMTAINM
jgi:hypothetical protein